MRKKSTYRFLSAVCVSILISGMFLYGCVYAFSHFFNYSYDAIVEDSQRGEQGTVQEFSLSVTANTTLEDVADLLEEHDLIGNKHLFLFQSKLLDATDLNSGTYVINNAKIGRASCRERVYVLV